MKIQVDPELLEDATHAYRRAAADVRESMGRFRQVSGSLTSPGVLGSDQATANMSHASKAWIDNLQRLATALDNIAGALHQALAEYRETDGRLARLRHEE